METIVKKLTCCACETTKFNDIFGHDNLDKGRGRCRQMLVALYQVGTCVGILTSVCSLSLLVYILVQAVVVSPTWSAASHSSAALLTPIVPGVNVAASHVIYIFVGFATSTLIHEAGHALALSSVGARIECVGWFVICGMPGAYVSCDLRTIRSLKPYHRLRVHYAGVWHNVLLVVLIFTSLFAWQRTPVLPSLFYQSGDGVNVVSVDTQPNVHGGDLVVGARIVSINDLPTSSLVDFENVLITILWENNKSLRFTTDTPYVCWLYPLHTSPFP